MTQMDSITDKLSEIIQQLKDKDDEFKKKDEELSQLQQVQEQLRRQNKTSNRERALLLKAIQRLHQEQDVLRRRLPPRNWRELKYQKTLQCNGECWSIAVQGDFVCVSIPGRVLLFSKTSGAQVRELRSDQMSSSGYGVAFIDENTIVVSGQDKRLRTYTTEGQLVCTFDSEMDGFDPYGLTVGPDGRIYVCDFGNHCVRVFNVDGKLLSSFGSEGSGVGQFTLPWDVCMDGEGLLFISNRGNSKICVYNVEGAFIREFHTPPPHPEPTCVAATHCNHLVVSSVSSDRVWIMTTSGQLVHEFGGKGSCPKKFMFSEKLSGPAGVAVDSEGCVYVCNVNDYSVQVYCTHQLLL